MSDLERSRVLLAAAGRDLRALRGMSDTGVFEDEIAGFHAQQAAEKMLKAWLVLLGESFPLTHDLDYLIRRLEGREPHVGRFEQLVEYNPYAVQFRYESFDADTVPLDREEAVRCLESLRQEVARRLAVVRDQGDDSECAESEDDRSGLAE